MNGQYFVREQDNNISEAIRALHGGVEPGAGDAALASNLHEYSARYVLENALNTPVRIEHAEYDSLVPNTTSPMTIKWQNTAGDWVKVKDGMQRPSSPYANGKDIWQAWSSTQGLYGCAPETSLYEPATGNPGPSVPTLGIWDNTDYSAMLDYGFGAHCALVGDSSLVSPMLQSFLRLNAQYSQRHNDPDDVAYRTYDNEHNGAWWLTVEAAFPNQDKPGLARVHRDKAGSTINVHVKNVKTTTLDVARMKLNTLSGKLTVTVDSNTAPESEFKVTDERRKTDLRLVGQWFPAKKGEYQVTLDSSPVAFDMTGTGLFVPNIDTTAGIRTITVTVPAGLESLNLLAGMNPGFESGTGGWSAAMDGGLKGVFELNDQPFLSHTGNNALRIKDPKATAAPFLGYWQSNPVSVQAGRSYMLCAFARTRAFNSVSRAYENGKYAPSSTSEARIGVIWLKADGSNAGWTNSVGVKDTTGWTPIDVTCVAPTAATQARAVLFTTCPNGQGIRGSVWFDDVVLSTESPLAVSSIAPVSGVNTGVVDTTLTGVGFKRGATVRLEWGSTVISATNVAVTTSGTTITCKLNINGLPLGKYDVVARNPDGQEAKLAGGFSVTDICGQGAGASISVFAATLGLMSFVG